MKPKNTICLWYDKDELEAARFYAATFPKSDVLAKHTSRSDRSALGWRRRVEARVRGEDANAEDRRRGHRGSAARLMSTAGLPQRGRPSRPPSSQLGSSRLTTRFYRCAGPPG